MPVRKNIAHAPKPQQGVALMIMLIIMVLGTATLLVSSLGKIGFKVEQNANSSKVLVEAKEILIGNLVAAQGGQAPGVVIRPDSFASTESPYNYDGENESGCLDATEPTGLPLTTDESNIRCLGRLPWKALKLAIESPSENDPTGVMPWYAVSANLYDPTQSINSELLNTATRPWLKVRDSKGNVLSDRVLFIVFMPGSAINGQTRPASPNLAGASQYLDSITVPANCTSPCVPGTYSNYDLDNDYISGEESRWVTDPDGSGKQVEDSSYHFNDKLIYVTVDEIMPLIEKRVAQEARFILNDYFATRNQFPDAASLGTTVATFGNDSGILPETFTCSCSSSTSCSCRFHLIRRVEFKRNSNSWSSSSGACSRANSNKTCRCTGAGDCRRSTEFFICDANGTCTHNTGGTYTFKRVTTSPTTSFSSPSGGCDTNGSDIECTSSGSFTVQDTKWTFSSWFTDNQWNDFMYYHRSTTSSLQTGTQGSVQALVISTGARIITSPFASKGSAQSRPSSNINNYLDSAENTNGDLIYEATDKSLSDSYNDQVFIVSPQ